PPGENRAAPAAAAADAGGGGGRGGRGGGGAGIDGYDSNFANIRTDYQNWGEGFISAYPPDQFIMLEKGATYGGGNNQIWAPYYTLHKILAGLLDCYEVGGNKKALQIATGMGSWVQKRLAVVPAATRVQMWNRYIAGEYGGMNEVMARMYRLTGDKQFLAGAQLFDNVAFFYGDLNKSGGLLNNVDTIRGRHANQHLPQITGALETYRDSNDIGYWKIADNFWDKVTDSYMYSIGGVAGGTANAEAFVNQPDAIWENGFARGGQNETCATYNMLKLGRQLFMFKPDQAKYMDYYEHAMYNDILASVAQNNAGNTYHIPLNPGSAKQFGNANMSGFTCCNGTALESNTKLQDSVYFRANDNSTLYVNLFVPSTLNWTEKKATVKQETSYPYADRTQITLTGITGTDVKVRVPEWVSKGFFIKINGVDKQMETTPGTYISLGKEWKDGATIELRMPFDFHLFRTQDQPNIASIMYGPIVLAAQEPAARQDWHPVELDPDNMGKYITGDPNTLEFKVGDAVLKPFSESYGRYSVYFDVKQPQ
ncbi:MAG TPA: beta-L-arabinofuranosidase domain-containing protein, partial [Phycisphaerae bacterium]|nr:beta-L-arabinofuranosidase domain-containing protein [Phycisphaerae bacterium]